MRKSVLGMLAALSLAGAATTAYAQPAPPPGPGAASPPPAHREPWMRPGQWRERMIMHRPFMPGTFALFYRQTDKQLTTADVGTIAQAILLWHGNHTWKVSGVSAGPDGTLQWAYTAPDGTVIARFDMDPTRARSRGSDEPPRIWEDRRPKVLRHVGSSQAISGRLGRPRIALN